MRTIGQRKIILASSSPRRREYLASLGIDYSCRAANVDETMNPLLSAGEETAELAERKAMVIAREETDAIVIGADTIVVCGDKVLGKPSNLEDARLMLQLLQGRWHKVYTGICVIDTRKNKRITEACCTDVEFVTMTDREIDRYLSMGESMDKAGAYAIQGYGSVFIKQIRGCYFNVLGLPLSRLRSVLVEFGIEC